MEYVESKDPLIQVVRTHQHHTSSTLLQIVKNFKKAFQVEIKHHKIHNSSENNRKMERKKEAWAIPT
jgi:hypothetical protein